jgi:hypothetical protein
MAQEMLGQTRRFTRCELRRARHRQRENKGPYTDAQGKQIAATQAATSMLKAL